MYLIGIFFSFLRVVIKSILKSMPINGVSLFFDMLGVSWGIRRYSEFVNSCHCRAMY